MNAPTPSWPEHDDAIAAQATAASPRHSAWVAANAGSGKTKVLIDRVARLLLQNVPPDTILCVTYTKAAASEMQDRLFRVLGDWSVMETDRLKAALALLEDRTGHTEEEIGRARALFARALETPGGLRIETIHAFCGRVLRRFPLEAGVAPGFREMDDPEAAQLWDEAMHALGGLVVRGDDATLLTAAQTAAEADGPGLPVLDKLDDRRRDVLRFLNRAGTIDDAIDRLRGIIGAPEDTADAIIARAMGPDLPRKQLAEIAAALPTAKPTDENLAQALATILSDAPDENRFTTWAALAFTADGKERKSNPYTADAAKRAPAVTQLFQMKDPPQGDEIGRILRTVEQLRPARIFERSAALLRVADVVFRDFARRKDAHAGLDFDDLIDAVTRLLSREHGAAADWVRWKLDGGVSHILLDEAQDTSPAQWEILDSLTDDIFAGQGVERAAPRTFFVVGDQKQSIYSFQGADPERFLEQARTVDRRARAGEVAFETPSLAMSWRSVPEVLTFVDETFDPAYFPNRTPFSLQPPVEADVALHTAQRRDEHGAVELWPIEPASTGDEPDPWDAPVDQDSETSPRARLARRIAAFVRAEIGRGAAISDKGQLRPARPGDFLILVKGRKNGLFDAILQALKLEGLPVAGADRILLKDSLAVQDLLNLVRFALCPEDDLTLAEIIKGPFGAFANNGAIVWLDDDDLFELAHDRKGASVWSRLQHSANPHHAPLQAFLKAMLARRAAPAFEYLTFALERASGLPQPGWELVLSRFGDPAREPVSALIDRASAFDAMSPASLELFLAAIEEHGGEVKRELSGPQDEVRVMTVHGAKGLEAPIVILPDTTTAPRSRTSGLFVSSDGAPVWPGAKTGDTPLTAAMREEAVERDLREHRRLLYVALTRARDRLVICGAWTGKKTTQGHDAQSWYALCNAAMQRLAESGRATTDTDGVHRLGPPVATAAGEGAAAARPAAPDWARRDAPPAPRARRILSPTALGHAEPPVLAPFGDGREQRLRRGRLIHALFQHLPALPPDQRRAAASAFLARQPDLAPKAQSEMLAAAFGVLDDPAFAGLFAQGGRAEVAVVGEWRGDLISGRIDRLVVTEAEVMIVDFKTDRPAPASAAGVDAAYLLQLAAYRGVLQQSWPGRAVRCLLAWTDGPQLMEIPADLLDKALAQARESDALV